MKKSICFDAFESKKITTLKKVVGGKGGPAGSMPSFTLPEMTINPDGSVETLPPQGADIWDYYVNRQQKVDNLDL